VVKWLLLVALAASCGDDRKRVADAIFRCDPTSPTADFDCGQGYTCYTAAQALGGAFCAPSCKPANPDSCPNGTCTIGGACLRHCKIENDNCGGDASPLHCVRSTLAKHSDGTNGLCVLVGQLCSTSDECTSPVFDYCTSEIFAGEGLPLAGMTCIQGGCERSGTACNPGSSCIPKVLGITGPGVPDVCTPNCERRMMEGKTVNECVVGLNCLGDVYPQTGLRACGPGFAGSPCTHDLSCVPGHCPSFESIDARMKEFRACGSECSSDDDCLPDDGRTSNVNFIGKSTCRGGFCHSFSSLLFLDLCLDVGSPGACRLDPAAECVAQTIPGASTRLGNCRRTCASDGDCDTFSANSHVPHICDDGVCAVPIPFWTKCKSDAQCLAGLSCLTTPIGSQCTRRCATSQECADTASLGSVFACLAGICVPRTAPGEAPPAPLADLCLGGMLSGGKCVSPRGWSCSTDAECASGDCSAASRCQ
jgi:hypothetical protein